MRFRLTEYDGNGFVTFDLSPDENNANALRLTWDVSTIKPIAWPSFNRIERHDNLWKTTCFELFLGSPTNTGYVELNFSPSGAWNAYSFDNYRSGMATNMDVEILEMRCKPASLEARLLIPQFDLPVLVGPSAVIEGNSGSITYFALSHGEQPDFHDAALHQRLDHL